MLENFIKLVAQDLGFYKENLGDQKSSVTIQIPKNHPKAESFLKLVDLMATSKVTSDGIFIKGLQRSDAEQRVLEALSDFVDINAILEEIHTTQVDKLEPLEKFQYKFKDPAWVGKVVEKAIECKLLNKQNSSDHELVRMMNMAKIDQGKKNSIEIR